MKKKEKKEKEEPEETKEEATEETTEKGSEKIVVRDPQVLRPKELPLVVVLPKSASKAQVAYAKILNSYAYQNPEKWHIKKDDRTVGGKVFPGLISRLKALKNAPDPVGSKLSIGTKLTANQLE